MSSFDFLPSVRCLASIAPRRTSDHPDPVAIFLSLPMGMDFFLASLFPIFMVHRETIPQASDARPIPPRIVLSSLPNPFCNGTTKGRMQLLFQSLLTFCGPI